MNVILFVIFIYVCNLNTIEKSESMINHDVERKNST